LPSHDPEESIELQDLINPVAVAGQTSSLPREANHTFYPFPNKNSFLLDNWYWNQGVQKSRNSLCDLLSVVGSPEFRPDDVRHTHWGKIDGILGRNDFDEDGEAGEWMDEDAGWMRTPLHISVPFNSQTIEPGPQDYLAGYLYHRSLVSVVREKLANTRDDEQFHYEPYELFWQPTETSPHIRVHGELYTSPEFIEAHRAIQEAPGEPGCNLPRVMVAMMFWSDGTELTQFGSAKLWPSYLYFGNESKYRRCTPNANLCNHVAYFEAVSLQFCAITPG